MSLSIKELTLRKRTISISDALRMSRNEVLTFPEHEFDVESISRSIEDLLLLQNFDIICVEDIFGRMFGIQNHENILNVIHFMKSNNSIKLISDFKEFNGKGCDDIEAFISNKILDSQITLTRFSPDSTINFIVNFCATDRKLIETFLKRNS